MVRHSVDDNGEDAPTPYFRLINKESTKSLENRIIYPITVGSTTNLETSQSTDQTVLKATSTKTTTRIINNKSTKSSENRIQVPSIEGKKILSGIDSIQNNKKDVKIKDKKGLFKDMIQCIKDLLKKPFIKNLKLAVNFYVIFFYLT